MIKTISVFLTATLSLVASRAQDLSLNEESRNWMKQSVYPVSDLDFNTMPFNQFSHLKKAVGNKRVVLLGEQTHGDGTTFKGKSLLIKYLHEEMGFDMIIFESGFYQSQKILSKLRSGDNSNEVYSRAIHSRWSHSEQIRPLFDYLNLQAKSKSPLEIVGMDVLFDQHYSQVSLLDDFKQFIEQKAPDLLSHDDLVFLERLVSNILQNKSYFPAKTDRHKFINIINDIINRLSEKPTLHQWNTKSFWGQVWKNFRANAINSWSKLDGTYSRPDFFNRRGKMMAENIKWHLERGKKVIIWAAANHNMRTVDPNLLEQMGWSEKTRFMGEYLSKVIDPEQMFHVTFTGFQGEYLDVYTNKVLAFQRPSIGSLEWLLNEGDINMGYFFLNQKDTPSWLKTPFKGSFVFNQEYLVKWSPSIDAIFFSKEMKASVLSK